MVQSPSWEANWFAVSQEMPCISWNPKVHYRILPPFYEKGTTHCISDSELGPVYKNSRDIKF